MRVQLCILPSAVPSRLNQLWNCTQALSHFSYHATGGHYVLCDIQGGVLPSPSNGVVLTDPVILSHDREFGLADLGTNGISTFFARHKCSRFCKGHWLSPDKKLISFPASVGTTMMVDVQKM